MQPQHQHFLIARREHSGLQGDMTWQLWCLNNPVSNWIRVKWALGGIKGTSEMHFPINCAGSIRWTSPVNVTFNYLSGQNDLSLANIFHYKKQQFHPVTWCIPLLSYRTIVLLLLLWLLLIQIAGFHFSINFKSPRSLLWKRVEWLKGIVSVLSNLSLFYRKLGLITFNSTLPSSSDITEFSQQKPDNIIISDPGLSQLVWTLIEIDPFIPLSNWDSAVRHTSNIGQIIHKSGTDWPNMFQTTIWGL